MEPRPARPEELALLDAVEDSSDSQFETVFGPDPFGDGPADTTPAAAVLVVGDPPVGFARLTLIDGHAHLQQLSVHRSAVQQGLGTALVRAAVAWAAAEGFDRLTLTTYRDVAWNAPFYARLGFAPVEPGPELAAIRERECAVGLDDHGPRLAMGRPTTTEA